MFSKSRIDAAIQVAIPAAGGASAVISDSEGVAFVGPSGAVRVLVEHKDGEDHKLVAHTPSGKLILAEGGTADIAAALTDLTRGAHTSASGLSVRGKVAMAAGGLVAAAVISLGIGAGFATVTGGKSKDSAYQLPAPRMPMPPAVGPAGIQGLPRVLPPQAQLVPGIAPVPSARNDVPVIPPSVKDLPPEQVTSTGAPAAVSKPSAQEPGSIVAVLDEVKDVIGRGEPVPDELLNKLPPEMAQRLIKSGIKTLGKDAPGAYQGNAAPLPDTVMDRYRGKDGVPSIPEGNTWAATGTVNIPAPGGGDLKEPGELKEFGLKP